MASDAPSAKRAKTDELRQARICVAGAGWWSQGWHLPHLDQHPGSTISAIIEPCDTPRSSLNPDMKPTKELAEQYGVPRFKNVDEFLESDAAKTTDGIIVCSNHATHHEIGTKCLKAGLHVLMEKPMTTDPKEAHELVEIAEKSNKIFMVNNTANFRDHARKAHELLKAGRIGTLKHVQCSMASALLWLFDDPNNVGWVKPNGSMHGNGFCWGQASHTLAWVYMVTDLTPSRVWCHMGYAETTGADIFNTAVVYCTSGATICVQGTAALPFISYKESSKLIDNKIFGTEGMLTYSGEDLNPSSGDLILRRHDKTEERMPGFYFENYKQGGDAPESVHAFIGGCLGRPYFNGADARVGLKAVQTIEAMYRSAKSGIVEAVL